VLALVDHATLLKISEEELEFLTGSADERAAKSLLRPDLRLLCVTRGAGGVEYYTPAASGSVPGFSVDAVDTTGAGDAFVAALLTGLSGSPDWEHATSDVAALEGILLRANAYAALTVTRPGAIPAMPTRAELETYLHSAAPGRAT